MPTLDEIRQLVARCRFLVQQDRVYLRRLEDQLAETRCVIERATITYTASERLLQKMDGFALKTANHKTKSVNEPRPHSIRCPRCQFPMVWYNADLADDRRALRHSYQCEKCGFISRLDDQSRDAVSVELAKS